MMTLYLDISTIHCRIRYAWRQYVLPACASRDAAALLAALVVADTSLDELLIAEGYLGRTTGDRMWNARLSFSDYESVDAARHTRHLAVHHLDYPLCWRAVAAALEAYVISRAALMIPNQTATVASMNITGRADANVAPLPLTASALMTITM